MLLAQSRGPASKALPCFENRWAKYLKRMQNAHDDLLRAIADMAAITQAPSGIREQYTAARWRLSKASKARRDLWDELYPKLYGRLTGQDAAALATLDAANGHLRTQSSAHISRWSAEAIDADWSTYCEASRTIRWCIMSILRHERRYVIPVLERLSRL